MANVKLKVIYRLFQAFIYVAGQYQCQPFAGFNSSSRLALCQIILIFGLKLVIFDEFLQPNPEL